MQFDPMQPIWLQVMTALKADIAAGKRTPGEKLPGGRDLALAYAINPNTAARVYQELEREGLCQTRRGLGTFVTEDARRITVLREEMALEAVRRCAAQLESLGVSRQEAARILLLVQLNRE